MPANPETTHLAEVAYAAWRRTAGNVLRPWSALPSYERIRWEWAVEEDTPQAMRERCCVGLYIAAWEDASAMTRLRWRQVAEAVAAARGLADAA